MNDRLFGQAFEGESGHAGVAISLLDGLAKATEPMERAAEVFERASDQPRNVHLTGPVYTSPSGLAGGRNGRSLRDGLGAEKAGDFRQAGADQCNMTILMSLAASQTGLASERLSAARPRAFEAGF